ncbi:hypothetical protein M8C21_025120 [Ambrosia artemisiifolia]|uniref:DELLA protein n=1 Tax=Ambrosia artemisiifolia TaxID=4212 RepID=A0AAD5H086_AMBAR|nr:hypothetical protein M8C21_025120 [Ambrosia artemisiifolia]
MWDDFTQPDTAVDELLAELGYQVKSSDMNDVAQKIEHLEGVFENDVALSQLVSDSVHYNPSDLSSYLESMISELNHNNNNINNSFVNDVVSSDDLQSIIYPPPSKKQKMLLSSSSSSSPSPTTVVSSSYNPNVNPTHNPTQIQNPNQIIIMDTQENGIRLVHTLMACAESVQKHDLKLAETLVNRACILAASQTGAMKKVALFFTQALACRIYNLNPNTPHDSPAFDDLLHMHFYETCPYIKFAHFTANQAILEAFAGQKKVHVIDFSIKQGLQWPALLQALALRPGGPPKFRLTGIGPPVHDNNNNINNNTDYLQEVGWKLAQLADNINVEFEYRGYVCESLADIEPGMLDLRDDEVVAVNSVFEMHKLLARPGSVEKVLGSVKEMNPVIVTVVEQEANHNGPVFMERFTESLHYYSTLFDSLESTVVNDGGVTVDNGGGDMVMSEMYLGKQICNVVACEGVERVERHMTLTQWKSWFDSAGLESVHLGSNAYKQASMLLALFGGGDGYRVEESNGCLMLGWHTRPLITTSAWKIGATR